MGQKVIVHIGQLCIKIVKSTNSKLYIIQKQKGVTHESFFCK